MWLNACSRGISIATGISSVATFATFIRLPVSMALGAASLTGAIASEKISTLTKKYQKKLKKVTCLIDIIMRATVVFDRVIFVALKDGIIDEEEFNTLQTSHLETLNELMGVDCRMKNGEQIPSRKKPDGRNKRTKEESRNKSLISCSLCYFICYFKNG